MGCYTLRPVKKSQRRALLRNVASASAVAFLSGLLSVATVAPVSAAPANQWGLNAINIDTAWAITEGSPNVTIAAIDSGIDAAHPAFQGQIVPGWNFITNTDDTRDLANHGTGVAGVAVGRDANDGFRGVAPGVRIMPLVVADDFSHPEQVVAAIDRAIAHRVDVINLSLGSPDRAWGNLVRPAVSRANDAGIPIVAAAGNMGRDIDLTPDYPSSFSIELPNVIPVAGIGEARGWAPLSNHGLRTVTIAAPGDDIRAPTIYGGEYNSKIGTSFAAPFVTGTVALMKSVNPSLNPGQIRDILTRTVTPFGANASLRESILSGGYLDAGRAVTVANGRVWDGKSVSVRSVLGPSEAVDATNAVTPGGSLSLRPSNENPEQTFKLAWAGEGWYRLESVKSPGSFITWNTLNQSAILASSNARPDRMFWRIDMQPSGMYRIVNKDDPQAVLVYTNIREVQVRYLVPDNRHSHWDLTPTGGVLSSGSQYTFSGVQAADAYARPRANTPGSIVELRRGQDPAATWVALYSPVQGGYLFTNVQTQNTLLTWDSSGNPRNITADTGSQPNQIWIIREVAAGTYEVINTVLQDSLTPVFLDNQNQVTDGSPLTINPYNSTTSQQWHIRKN